jgi:hypothetical protein
MRWCGATKLPGWRSAGRFSFIVEMTAPVSAIDAGCVKIQLDCQHGRVVAATIQAERPDVARVLCGKPADAAVALVPLIFALCGRAQGRAAALALAAARGIETAPHLDAAVECEVLREHLWRLLLDLPPMLGLNAQHGMFAVALRALNLGARDTLAESLNDPFWNQLMAALADQDEPDTIRDDVEAWLPAMSAHQSLVFWPRLTRALSQAPLWQGLAAETGAYARWGGQNPAGAPPFAARWHARCAELWSWAADEAKVDAGGTVSAAVVAPGIGRALVETARGVLMHEITLDPGGYEVVDYRIVAPTEWNFHPQGILSEWLLGRAVDDAGALERFVSSAVSALDPCVRWELRRN